MEAKQRIELKIALLTGEERVLKRLVKHWFIGRLFYKGWLRGVNGELSRLENEYKALEGMASDVLKSIDEHYLNTV